MRSARYQIGDRETIGLATSLGPGGASAGVTGSANTRPTSALCRSARQPAFQRSAAFGRGAGVSASAFLERYLPRIVTGPVMMVIGLILAPVGVNMALGRLGDGATVLVPEEDAIVLAGIALVTSVAVALRGRGLIRVIPILTGAVVGYAAALLMELSGGTDLLDFSEVAAAPWFNVPSFVLPTWNWQAIVYMVPVAIAPAIEHFGDMLAIRGITGKDYLKDPGIQNTMLGDGLATSVAGLLGGPPSTTYSEVTGAVALTRAFNPALMTWAAVWAIGLSFIGKLGALLQTIPTPVIGGILVLLFGAITVVGLNSCWVRGTIC